jgi:hypothetical protein
MNRAAIRKRGGSADIRDAPRKKPDASADARARERTERALDEALEETMAGSDPVSITQPRKDFIGHKK